MFDPRKVAVIGGTGHMGSWFAKFFADQSCSVTISGRSFSKARAAAGRLRIKAVKSNIEAVKGADLVIISVMADTFERVVKEIAPYTTEKQVVIDLTSVKEMPVRLLHKHIRRSRVLGTHPMFGPSVKTPDNQNIVLTPTNKKEKILASDVGKYLRKRGFNIITLTPRKHDEMISIILSLTHFVGFVTADTWQRLKVERYVSSSSTSFRFLRSFVFSIVESDPYLYSYLQAYVPGAASVEKLFTNRSKRWAKLTSEKRTKELARSISSLRSYIQKLG